MLLIKLGGSVITNKDRKCTFLPKRTRRIVEELRYLDEPIIITHGGGSFGHNKASYYRLGEGYLDELKGTDVDQVKGFCEVQKDMRDLNNLVLDMMTKFKLKTVSVPATSVVTFCNGKISRMEFKMFDKIRSLGAIPVAFGDVVFDTKRGFGICSADDLMVRLAKRYRPNKAVFVTDVDGLFSEDPEKNLHASLVREVRSARDIPKGLRSKRIKPSEKDVTGAMGSKARAAQEIASAGCETWLVNGCIEDRMNRVLKGYDVVGTRFVAKKPKKKASKRRRGGRKKGGGRKG